MEKELRLYTVSDEYVQYLSKFDKKVMSNKEEERKFERKYLGIIFNNNEFNYFVPLASPKGSDYFIDENGDKQIRKSIIPIIRMLYKNSDGETILLGTLKLNNMIPVMDDVVNEYDAVSEPHSAYRDLVYKEWDFIRKNKSQIYNHASILYKQKIRKLNISYLDNTVDFPLLEQKMKEYISHISTRNSEKPII